MLEFSVAPVLTVGQTSMDVREGLAVLPGTIGLDVKSIARDIR